MISGVILMDSINPPLQICGDNISHRDEHLYFILCYLPDPADRGYNNRSITAIDRVSRYHDLNAIDRTIELLLAILDRALYGCYDYSNYP